MYIDPRNTIFVGASSSWVDQKDGHEVRQHPLGLGLGLGSRGAAASAHCSSRDTGQVVGMRTFTLLHRSIGTFGIQGLDRLLSFMIVTELRALEHRYEGTGALGQL